MTDERLTLFERRTGETLWGLVDRRQPVSRINETIRKAREHIKSQPSIEPYMVEASVRRMLDTPGGLLGYTPSMVASETGQDKTLGCLLENGAGVDAVDAVGTTLLQAAASASQLACVSMLVSRVNIDQRDSRGDSALHWACSRGDMKIIGALVEHGASVNLKNNAGATPIYNACYNGHYEAVDYLIQRGASLSAQNNNGDTALHIAVSFSQLSIVDSLIRAGARTSIRNNDGRLAIEMTESDTVRAAVEDVMPAAGKAGNGDAAASPAAGAGAGAGGAGAAPVWKPPLPLPAPSLPAPAMREMLAKLRATTDAHGTIEPKTLLRSLQGSLDKLSWWRFENQYDAASGAPDAAADASTSSAAPSLPPSQRVVTSADLVPLCAYLRFSSQCGVDVRPTTLEIRVEEPRGSSGRRRAYFLLPMASSLVQPAAGDKLLLHDAAADDSDELVEATSDASASFYATTAAAAATEGPAARSRAAALEALRRAADADVGRVPGSGDDEADEATLVTVDLSQDVREACSVCVLVKEYDEKTRLWTRVAEQPGGGEGDDGLAIPGFSAAGAPKLLCKGGMTARGDEADALREKGVAVLTAS